MISNADSSTVRRRSVRLRAAVAAAGTIGLVFAAAGVAVAKGDAPAGKTALASSGQRNGRVQLTLPEPTGPHRIGTTSLHLVDRSRKDPWISRSSPRELMISVWYPAARTRGERRAPWLPPKSAALYKKQTSQSLGTSLDNVDLPLTHAYQDAPAAGPRPRSHPVVLFSPGFAGMRQFNTALVEDLASRGYVVVTIDHTYEASFVEFPGGRLELGKQPPEPSDAEHAKSLRVRQADTRFVLDALAKLDAGKNPDAEHRRLPRGLRGTLDLSRTGMFGHSVGGDTAAEIMAEDRRVRAGVDLDGSINGPAAATGLDRPFMLMGSPTHGRFNDSTWTEFWSNLRGWRLDLRLSGAAHQTYTDMPPLVRQLEKAVPLPPEVIARLDSTFGTIPADRAIAAQRAYLTAFFDLHLRHRDGHLLSGPSPRFPEITFVP